MTRSDCSPESARLVEVADGVYAYIQPDGGWCLSNAGVIGDGSGTAVVDTAATHARALRLRQAVASLTPHAPDVVINTHHHGDHTFGNQVFAGPVVAHELARREMAESGLGLTQLWPDVEWGEITLKLPSVTFRDELTLHVGQLRVELIHVGPAHTSNDTVVWIPDRGVLFVGDVAMAGATPFCLMGSVQGSLDALARLRELTPQVVVPGHGPVSGPEVFDRNEAYLRWLQRLAEEGERAGVPPLELARQTDLGEFVGLSDSERLVANLRRAYAERTTLPLGAPLDVLRSFEEMVEFHGGLPACHA